MPWLMASTVGDTARLHMKAPSPTIRLVRKEGVIEDVPLGPKTNDGRCIGQSTPKP
jgi:hypothetical protein